MLIQLFWSNQTNTSKVHFIFPVARAEIRHILTCNYHGTWSVWGAVKNKFSRKQFSRANASAIQEYSHNYALILDLGFKGRCLITYSSTDQLSTQKSCWPFELGLNHRVSSIWDELVQWIECWLSLTEVPPSPPI